MRAVRVSYFNGISAKSANLRHGAYLFWNGYRAALIIIVLGRGVSHRRREASQAKTALA